MTSKKPMVLIAPEVLQRIQNEIDKDLEFKKKLREQLDELDRATRTMIAILSQCHSSTDDVLFDTEAFSQVFLDAKGQPVLPQLVHKIKEIADEQPYYKYNGIWSRHMENASFVLVFLTWIGGEGGQEGKLLTYEEVAERMAIPTDEEDMKFHLSIEEYLQSLISLINELSRLAVNSVTMGNYARPLAISRFVKELSTAFQILNLKNDNLRKRFDSIKYDVKKIEEVVYDLSLRRLIPKD